MDWRKDEVIDKDKMVSHITSNKVNDYPKVTFHYLSLLITFP